MASPTLVYGPVAGLASGTFAIPTNATGGGNYIVLSDWHRQFRSAKHCHRHT